LHFADLLTVDGYEFWDTLFLNGIAPQNDDTSYTLRDGDRIDLLAFNFYGDPVLWWVIAVANNLEFLPTDLKGGQILRIPSVNYVTKTLFTLLRT
jgi:hypothetical protein